MDKQEAIAEAARAVLDHGGPHARTDPRVPVAAIGRALDTGATHDEITAEIRRQRNT